MNEQISIVAGFADTPGISAILGQEGFFDKSVSISSGSHNVLVHVEGWCPNEQINGVVELPIIGGGCRSATITIPTPTPTPTKKF